MSVFEIEMCKFSINTSTNIHIVIIVTDMTNILQYEWELFKNSMPNNLYKLIYN